MAQKSGLRKALEDYGDILLAVAIFGLLAVMVVPLRPWIMDALFAVSIGFSLMLFLGVVYVRKPVELSAFPSLVLMATVFRLALNVASTRLILLGGPEGSHAAGRVIETFGSFVIGGNPAVGFVVFAILVVINFIVITKGATRVAEVSARFTLDAMPGKQMAIDAELNSGLIDETTARKRRDEISKEADFYGSMDGASKFVRGDAIAGIVILLVNLVGGVFIGTIQMGMDLTEALNIYVLLTIGDGLVAQIPALIVSMSAGLLVTRVPENGDDRKLHDQVTQQLLNSSRALWLLAAALGVFALIPGVHLTFFVMAAGVAIFAWQLGEMAPFTEDEDLPAGPTPGEARPEDLLAVEPLAIEVGVDLLYLVDDRSGEAIQRIQKVRNQFAQDLGVVIPPVHLRDNLKLEASEYAFLLRGEEVARGTLQARQQLALDPGGTTGKLKGIATTDPVFGLPAWWIPESNVLKAQAMGYTVVDVPTVLTTHLVEFLHEHTHELYDMGQLTLALERVSQTSPRLVDDLIPDPLPRHVCLRVFRNLLREGVSVRDAQTILEVLAEYAPRTKEPDVLTEFVRQRLARHITKRFTDGEGVLHYIGFAPDAEDALMRGLATSDGAPSLNLEPSIAHRFFSRIREFIDEWQGATPPVVLCPPLARGALRRMLERALPRAVVLSSAELLPSVKLERVGLVDLAPPPKKDLK